MHSPWSAQATKVRRRPCAQTEGGYGVGMSRSTHRVQCPLGVVDRCSVLAADQQQAQGKWVVLLHHISDGEKAASQHTVSGENSEEAVG